MKQVKKNSFKYFIYIVIFVMLVGAIFGIVSSFIPKKDNDNDNKTPTNKYTVVDFSTLKKQLTPNVINDDSVYVTSYVADIIKHSNSYVDITTFGAIPNDNIDDTTAIQNAINSLTNGGVVYIPSGTFLVNVDDCINLNNNIALLGNGNSSILKLIDNQTNLNNILKAESKQNVVIYNLAIDGNRANQNNDTTTQYGVFISGSSNCFIEKVYVYNTNGVGIHLYNTKNSIVNQCYSIGNKYHGFEIEQSDYCQLLNSYGKANDRHGVLISPGEVGSNGSHYNTVKSNYFFENKECGVSFSLANDDLGNDLSYANSIINNFVFENEYCGIQSFKVDKCYIKDNLVANNGGFGIYLYSSKENVVSNNYLMNNSQKTNGGFDEIRIESTSAKDSCNSTISNNTIVITGNVKARYGIHDTSVNGNFISDNNIAHKGTTDFTYIVKK